MYNSNSSSSLTNVTFSANTADWAGGMYNSNSNPVLTNVTFSGNSVAYGGGGMYNISSSPVLTNVTLSGNSATNGGGVYNNASNPTLTNSILWGNTPGQIYGDATVEYCLIQGGFPGPNILDQDPQFEDRDGADNIVGTPDDNLQLKVSSPAIDAGNNTFLPAWVTTDLAGNPRYYNTTVDLGAYENQPGPAPSEEPIYLPLIFKNSQ